jgi:hypothetical protein
MFKPKPRNNKSKLQMLPVSGMWPLLLATHIPSVRKFTYFPPASVCVCVSVRERERGGSACCVGLMREGRLNHWARIEAPTRECIVIF